MTAALEVRDLTVVDARHGATLVDGVSLSVAAGECLGVVGESGSGKSLTLRAVAGVLPHSTRRSGGAIDIDGHTAMVFQEPMSTLNPTMRVGTFIAEGARARGELRSAAAARARRLLAEVGVPDGERRMRAWPHELSGGLRQRAMIAAALATEPTVLLCDEPTTALDVTVQAQLIALLDRMRTERSMAMVFVSHNLAVVAQLAQRIAVMYAGRVVEEGPTARMLAAPEHPYTAALLASLPDPSARAGSLVAIPGAPPDPHRRAAGCAFAPRCTFADEQCRVESPELAAHGDHRHACHHPLPVEVVVR